MTTLQTDIQTEVTGLAKTAFEAFGEDISAMFGLQVSCSCQQSVVDNFANIKKRFIKLTAVNSIKTEGTLQGTFYLVFDQKAMFVLAGSVVMQPKSKILDNSKIGGQKEAEDLRDAVQEVGNLLVGSWDRVYRERLENHKHFVKTSTFIGELQEAAKKDGGPSTEGQYNVTDCEITVGDFPPCHCIVMFPEALWNPAASAAEQKAAPADANPKDAVKPADGTRKDAEVKPQETTKPVEVTKKDAEAKTQESPADANQKPSDAIPQNPTAIQAQPAEQESIKTNPGENKPKEKSSPVLVVAAESQPITAEHSFENTDSGDDLLKILAGDIMNRCQVWASPEDSVEQVLSQMQCNNTGYVLVGGNGICHGIISRSNIAGAISPFLKPIFAKWRRPLDDASLQIKVKWIMSTPVHVVPANATLYAVLNKMSNFGGRCLPVADTNNKIVGIITVFDIFKAMINNDSEESVLGTTIQSPPLVRANENMSK